MCSCSLVLGNFLTDSYTTGFNDTYRVESYLARVRYNFNEKYFFDASFRRDGSSRFHPDNRWGNFFSVGANWNIKKESFMANVDKIDALKLRAAFGEVGNDAGVGLYGYQALYEIDKNGGKTSLMKKSLAGTARQNDFAALWPMQGPALSIQYAIDELRIEADKHTEPRLKSFENAVAILENAGLSVAIAGTDGPVYVTPGTSTDALARQALPKA